ncbi:MAG: PQQ-binding-like beta-propeller repeat protein [Acidimicrobiia bacterium]
MVSPSTLERPRSAEPRKPPIRWWTVLAIVIILALLFTNALAWYLLAVERTSTSTTAPEATDTTVVADVSAPPAPVAAVELPPIISPGDLGVYGTHQFRGGNSLSGETDGGFRTLEGVYWDPVRPGGFFGADPIAYGRFLYVVSATHDSVYGIDQTSGLIKFMMRTNGRMQTAPAVGQFEYSLGPEGSETRVRLVAVSENGTVYARNATGGGNSEMWQRDLNEDVLAAPLIEDNKIIVATEAGTIIALGLDNEEVWRYPVPNTYTAAFRHTPAISAGIIYAVDENDRLHMVDLDTGNASCAMPISLRHSASSHPVVAGDQLLIPTDGSILVLPTAQCGALPQIIAVQVDSTISPAVSGSTIFTVENSFLLAWNLETRTLDVWDGPFQAESPITTAPAVAGGVIYFGTQQGVVHAVDAGRGESLWTFEVGEPIFGGPVVTANAIFVTTTQEIISIAGR